MKKRIDVISVLMTVFIVIAVYGIVAFILWLQSEAQAELSLVDFEEPVTKGVSTGLPPDISQLAGVLELSTSPEMLVFAIPPGNGSKIGKAAYFPVLRPSNKSLMLIWKTKEPIKIRLLNRFYKTLRPDKVTLYADFSRQENRRFLAPAVSVRDIPLNSTQKWVDLKIYLNYANPIILYPGEKLPIDKTIPCE